MTDLLKPEGIRNQIQELSKLEVNEVGYICIVLRDKEVARLEAQLAECQDVCPDCKGTGYYPTKWGIPEDINILPSDPCPTCQGTGKASTPDRDKLREKILSYYTEKIEDRILIGRLGTSTIRQILLQYEKEIIDPLPAIEEAKKQERWNVGEELCCLIGNKMIDDIEAGKLLGKQLEEYMNQYLKVGGSRQS